MPYTFFDKIMIKLPKMLMVTKSMLIPVNLDFIRKSYRLICPEHLNKTL